MVGLKHIFKAQGVRQRLIAAQLGVSEPTVSHWASGRQHVPSEFVLPLARLLGVPAERLLPADKGVDGASCSDVA
jgi:transcriptional regulator with XRE-family HTH domain